MELNSDHRMVTSYFKLSLKCHHKNKLNKSFKNWTTVTDNKYGHTKFMIEVQNRYTLLYNGLSEDECEETNNNYDPILGIQKEYDKFKGFVEDTINATILPQKKGNLPWISQKSYTLRRQRDEAKLRHIRNKSKETRKVWKDAIRILDESYKNDKIKYYNRIYADLSKANQNNNLHEVYKIINKLSCKKSTTTTTTKNASQIQKENGEHLTNNLDLMNEWESYFRTLLNPASDNLTNLTYIKEAEINLPINTNAFTLSEILPIIHSLKNRKSVGIDRIPAEFIKYGGRVIHNHILRICNSVFENEIPPEDWKINIVIPIPKKSLSRTLQTSDFRGISMMSIPAKIYNRLILNRIYDEINKKLRINQAGFRRNMNTTQQINTIRRILEGFKEKQLPLVCSFVDFTKAFDSINREVMWQILRHYGIPTKIVDAIKCIYKNSKSIISIENNFSNEIETTAGVLQGDTLAPFLFIIVIDYIMTKIPANYGVVTHLNPIIKLSDLGFADDIVLFDSSYNKAYQHLLILEKEAAKVGLRINYHKTKYISNIITEDEDKLSKTIERAKEFIYLGSNISSSEEDIKRRMSMARKCFWNLKRIWRANDIPLKLKINIFKTTCLSVLLYGCESWIISKKSQQKLNAFALNSYRYILGIKKLDMKSNIEILEAVEMRQVYEIIQERQRKFITELALTDKNVIASKYLMFRLEMGKRKKGRPRISYDEYIENSLGTNLGLDWPD